MWMYVALAFVAGYYVSQSNPPVQNEHDNNKSSPDFKMQDKLNPGDGQPYMIDAVNTGSLRNLANGLSTHKEQKDFESDNATVTKIASTMMEAQRQRAKMVKAASVASERIKLAVHNAERMPHLHTQVVNSGLVHSRTDIYGGGVHSRIQYSSA